MEMPIRHNPELNRFEVVVETQTAVVEYRRRDDKIFLVHTLVPPVVEGKGVGTALAKYALDYARENSLRVVPSCPFIAAYIESHPEYADLVG